MPNPDDPLDSLLERWRRAAPPPPSLSAEVWRRLESESQGAGPGILARLAADFVRPAFAITFIAACALLGLFLAEVRISRLQAERNRELAASYMRLIDPLFSADSKTGSPAGPQT